MKRWMYAYTVVRHDPKKPDELLRSHVPSFWSARSVRIRHPAWWMS